MKNTNWNDPNFQGFGRQPRPKKERKAVGTPLGRTLLNIAVTLVFAAVYFYIVLPPISLKSEDFYVFVLLVCAVYGGCAILTSGFQGAGAKGYFTFLKKQCTVPLIAAAALIATALVGAVIGWQLFRAGDYRDLLTVTDGDFAAEVEEISYDQIPMLDANSATKLGNRKLGELADMVSQFEVADDYTQINYQGRPVRVTPLRYGDIIKWLNNRADGLPAYLLIDMVTQNVEVIRLDEGIHYTTAEHFSRNLYRHLRFQYPTFIFDEPSFEIDEQGTPFWVCPRVVKRIGLFGGTDIQGAVLVNAVTGESEYYTDIPSWVDGVYSAKIIMEQYDYYGTYQGGYINSLFGQKNVTRTTAGYNYIAIDDDVYVYTGVTSAGSDESNIGFILTNQRTKQTTFYSIAGAEEFSAMNSAEGVVQNLDYTATFPLLLNISNQPTYFMALKDYAGLVKMYAMVNVQQYQVVATGATVEECQANYYKLLRQNKLDTGEAPVLPADEDTVSGMVTALRSAVIDGTTMYYVTLDDLTAVYAVSAGAVEKVILLNVGDRITVTYEPASVRDDRIYTAVDFEWVKELPEQEPPAEEPAEQPETPDTPATAA